MMVYALQPFGFNQVVQGSLDSVIVICWAVVACLREGKKRKASFLSVISTNLCGVSFLIIVNLTFLLPKVLCDMQQLLHPGFLTAWSISQVKFASHDKQRVVLLNQVVVVPRIVNEVVEFEEFVHLR